MNPKIEHRQIIMLLFNGEHIDHLASTQGCADRGAWGLTNFKIGGHAAGSLACVVMFDQLSACNSFIYLTGPSLIAEM